MRITELVLTGLGLVCGFAVAAGTFALIAALGIIPRMAGKAAATSHVIALENAVIVGGIFGTVIELFDGIPLGRGCWFAVVYGVCSGIFAGCLSTALAEVLHVLPILFRRAKLKTGLNLLVLVFALGKAAGAFYYFAVLFR
ncbi:MAG: stage V sporulation protein AB [Lachnospiraceae bacterium]|nr:stage V sporulation protein AB [Lachnospiraceae bacterium]